jgi:hypothetical protein
MLIEISRQVTINAPAHKVWRVVAHEFDQIGRWATLIPRSQAVTDGPAPEGAPVCGRVCGTAFAGFSDVRETFDYYDEQGMRFGYTATDGLPAFVTRAQNHWLVRALGPDTTLAEGRGEVDVRWFPGIFVLPLLQLQLRRAAAQVFEELKYYIEHDQPHPRKLAVLRKQARKSAAPF